MFWHLICRMMHLKMNSVECRLSDLVCRSGFLWGRIWWRAKSPEEGSAPRRYPRTHTHSRAHIHSHSKIGFLGIRWTTVNLPETIFFFFWAPTDIILFYGVHTTFFLFSYICLGVFHIQYQTNNFVIVEKNTRADTQLLLLFLPHYCCSIQWLLPNLVTSDSGPCLIIIL